MNDSRNTTLLAALAVAALGAPQLGAQPTGPDTLTNNGPHITETTQYAAIWQETAEERRWQAGDDPAAVAAPPTLTARGFRLVDVEVWFEGKERRYLGVYRRAEAPSHLVAGLDEQGFRREGMKQRGAGRCLVGFEAWQEKGKALYAGVWAPAECGAERLVLGAGGRAFQNQKRELASSHHLVDLETVRTAAGLELSGVWHAGAEGKSQLAYGLTWEDFHHRIHQLTPGGLRLADIEIDRAGKQTYYSGVWRAGGGTDWLGVGYLRHGFELAHGNLMAGKGFGLPSDKPAPGGKLGLASAPAASAARPARMMLVALEVWGTRHSEIPQHGAPLHDSGTAGYP